MQKITQQTTITIISVIWVAYSSLSAAHPLPDEETQEEPVQLETVEIEGRATDLIGIASSASQGVVGQPEFKYRPLARVGELVEIVPGAIATQHSGSGKANQFFLRGFNLDHGTDFTVSVDGIPMNMPSHAHGQGYLDLNGVIPELVDKVEYGKGPYYAEVGDFSSAGFSKMHTMHKLDKNFVKFTGGEFDFYRSVLGVSHKLGDGDLLLGSEVNFYDGVWEQAEDLKKYNGMLRYTVDKDTWGYSLNGKAYHSTWTATNQIPERAIDSGLIGLYGTGDGSDGGITNRYSVSGNYWNRSNKAKNEFNVYALYSDLDLFSNFTGYINPVTGDQIEQKEERVQVGGNAEHTRFDKWFGIEMDNTLGLQVRHDEIMGLALNQTQQRNIWNTVREDDISETSVGLFIKNEAHWLEKFRTVAGLRTDFFEFEVDSKTLKINSGSKDAAIISPKLSMIFGPWYDTDIFLNGGYGYHSNDARGTTIKIDPTDGVSQVSSVTPLSWSRGAEFGVRTQHLPGLTSTVALWWLESSSELVFVGDGGTTEPSGKSERYGVEWTNYYKPTDYLTFDADFAFTSAKFIGVPSGENHIPNSVGRVISFGATIESPMGLFGTLRLRHFGDVPLVENGAAWNDETNIVNLGLGYQKEAYKVEVDVFNLLDSTDNDIAYFYGYRLQGEAAGPNEDGSTDGLIRHPIEPRMVRVTATLRF